MLKAEVVKCRGCLSSRMYYGLRVQEENKLGYTLQLSDTQYSRMLYSRTGEDESDHGHPEAKKFFDKLAEQINMRPAVAACAAG